MRATRTALAVSLVAVVSSFAAEFLSLKEGVPGVAVQDRSNVLGRAVGVMNGTCRVNLEIDDPLSGAIAPGRIRKRPTV